MNFKDIAYKILTLSAIVSFAACSEILEDDTTNDTGTVEMKNIVSAMTRAGSVAELKDYVGKDEFDDKDRAVFVTIKRTSNPINQFTYSNIEFECAASTSAEGVKSIGWSRDKNTGTTGGSSTETHPDRIYWSDATNPHTFIGYCAPQQGEGKAFDWEKKTVNSIEAYYGSIGDPTVFSENENDPNHYIDFRSTFDSEGRETNSGNVELRKNDILLTHSTEITAQDAIAKLYFYHGLAQVRVIVNISDFAAGGGDDTKSTVSNMVLKDMLTMYKWGQVSVATEQLADADQTILDELYPSADVKYDQRKDFNLWIPEPKGVGEKSSRTFTFYGMAVPTQIPEIDSEPGVKGLEFSFKVTYPDPMKPAEMKEHTYNASIGGIHFDAGKCTTISISLNHKNEKMTVGAEYDDWEFENTPDQGELKKNSTFLAFTDRTAKDGNYNVTIIGDQNATADDATWLYIDGTGKIVDIYGNDGSEEKPFQISTADQFLSFAYEVKGTGRTSVNYTDLKGASQALSSNFDFTGYHIVLDADLTLQKNETKSKVELDLKKADKESDSYKNAPDNPEITWIGIGDDIKDSEGKYIHSFNGTFQGGFRHINRLYGKPLFNNVGPDGIVDHVFISEAIGITGTGSIAEVNNGIICGANIEGDIVEADYTDYCGSIVGVNNGVLIACSHIGGITGNANILGALLGQNDGILVTCYNVGDAKNTHSGGKAYAGVGEFTIRSIAYCCYFNKDFYTSQDYNDLKADGTIGHVAFPLTTAVMQSNKYVNQAAVVPPPSEGTNTGEITDPSVKRDIFFYHWSLNEGLNRAIQLLSTVYEANPDVPDDEYLTFHTEADRGGYLSIGVKKHQVKWLVDHFKDNSHQFQFIPGTYPKLK